MTLLFVAIVLTLSVSFVCSLLEAFILSLSEPEIASFKKRHAHLGAALERYKQGIEETSSAILTLNTIANTAGATWIGTLASDVFALEWQLGLMTAALTVGILLLSEILPKNIGVAYRTQLTGLLTPILGFVRAAMKPFSFMGKRVIRLVVAAPPPPPEETKEEEIVMLAEKHAQSGALTGAERDLIRNTLTLDDLPVSEIMTPRSVVAALDARMTVGEVFQRYKNIPFGRLPVFQDSLDHIVGVARRRDLLTAYADDKDAQPVGQFAIEAIVVPETTSAADTLDKLLRKHQKLAVVIDEYGSTAGVVTIEDIIEQLLGHEIYEDTDVAVDMREFAKNRALRRQSASNNTRGPFVQPLPAAPREKAG